MAMKFDSPIYDRIRVKPDMDRRVRAQCPDCEWTGCANAATHRAPKGRGKEHEYWRFCLDHVREYNHSYNFFAGMSDEAVARYQKDAITGHRPTWKMGTGGRSARERVSGFEATDPFDVGQEFGATGRKRAEQQRVETRTVHNAARKALHALSLEEDASRTEIKARFKTLVKRHHPDANGGSTASEDKLREIIEAYNYLKSAGFC
jgi:DnaJ domain